MGECVGRLAQAIPRLLYFFADLSWLFAHSKATKRITRARLGVLRLEDRITPSVNPIVAENQLPGTPQSVWDITGVGAFT